MGSAEMAEMAERSGAERAGKLKGGAERRSGVGREPKKIKVNWAGDIFSQVCLICNIHSSNSN